MLPLSLQIFPLCFSNKTDEITKKSVSQGKIVTEKGKECAEKKQTTGLGTTAAVLSE